MAKQNNKKHILFRYGLISLGFFLFSLIVVLKLVRTTVFEAAAWNERARAELSRVDTVLPERGKILAANGNILACNMTVYDIKIDLRHNKIARMRSINWESVDSLADSLDRYFPRRENLRQNTDTFNKYSWHTRLRREFEKDINKRNRALRVARNATQREFEQIKGFPFLNQFKGKGFKNPVYAEEKNKRVYPYGKMAYRSIGRVNQTAESKESHGYSGLEMYLDSMLFGQPGLAKKVALTSGFTNWITSPPKRGVDVRTTIDIDLQDMLEDELQKVCLDAKAEWGTAVLMEVATGEIKAISNIERMDDGSYGEALNRAVLPFEPGSVMKPISLMIAFEDGLVHNVSDQVSCAPFQKTSDPHGSGYKSMKQVIEQSSNPGIARVIFQGYAKDPSLFYDRMKGMGFFEPMRSGIAGESTPRIRKLLPTDSRGNNITMTARHLDLARQAYGYNTELPPLFTLSVYNAIANKGRYVRPRLMKGLSYEDGRDSVIPVQYIRQQLCSEATARKVSECMAEVVWGEHGTARKLRDDRVKIVGKTGTVFPVEKGGYNKAKRRYAFAGFFPYEAPKYSCMALVLAPGANSAANTSGMIVKNMAIKMFARGMLDNTSLFTQDSTPSKGVLAASKTASNSKVSAALGGMQLRKVRTAEAPTKGKMPDLRGYDAPSAIKILESEGITVKLTGKGHVVGQSVAAGTSLRMGQSVELRLKI